MDAQHRIAQICREQAIRMRHAIEKMEEGKMWTGTVRDGQRLDTTAETMDEYSAAAAELEACAARIEAGDA